MWQKGISMLLSSSTTKTLHGIQCDPKGPTQKKEISKTKLIQTKIGCFTGFLLGSRSNIAKHDLNLIRKGFISLNLIKIWLFELCENILT